MRWLALVFALAAVPTPAAASSCYLGPFVAATELPAGCPIVIYANLQFDTTPVVQATRDGMTVDVTGEIEREVTMLDVAYPQYACDGSILETSSSSEEYARYRVSVENALPGETLLVHGMPVRVTEAAACPAAVAPTPSCGYAPQGCNGPGFDDDDDDDGGGCHTSGNSYGGAAALALLGLVRRRRRQ